MSSETILNTLRSWFAIEALTMTQIKGTWRDYADAKKSALDTRAKGVDSRDRIWLWETPADTATCPWSEAEAPQEDTAQPKRQSAMLNLMPPVVEEPQDNIIEMLAGPVAQPARLRDWYVVTLGVMPAEPALKIIDEAFQQDDHDEEGTYRDNSYVIAATLTLDDQGCYVENSLSLSSFGWAVGQIKVHGKDAALANWPKEEGEIMNEILDLLKWDKEMKQGEPLDWEELRTASRHLAGLFGLDRTLWGSLPCTVRVVRKTPPDADLLNSFYLTDLAKVMNDPELPQGALRYLGGQPPNDTWDALTDRTRLSELLDPALFPLGRWPGPGRHPLTLLQQAAVNVVARDLNEEGIAAVNGPPGTGKTTLLRDIVAYVMTRRADKLCNVADPGTADLSKLDLMDDAIVVASSNNAAVENISLELPLRGKALAQDLWEDSRLDYFAPVANSVLGLDPASAGPSKAWGMLAARLGNAGNRKAFFDAFWWDKEMGLDRWFDAAAFPNHQRTGPSKLMEMMPPPRPTDAKREWQKAKIAYQDARDRCLAMRNDLARYAVTAQAADPTVIAAVDADIELSQAETRETAADLEQAKTRLEEAEATLSRATTMLDLLRGLEPPPSGTTQHDDYKARVMTCAQSLTDAQAGADAARVAVTEAQDALCLAREFEADARARQENRIKQAAQHRALQDNAQRISGSHVPGPEFWSLPEEQIHVASPWNGGAFRAARDDLFACAVRLHKAFNVCNARNLRRAIKDLSGVPLASPVSAANAWGQFFALVPVVSTTFASFTRMFGAFSKQGIGWLIIDEAGQANPQAAMGAIWRAKRSVVIGDPLQIEPVTSLAAKTTRLIFESNGADPAMWAAPSQSAQTLADRASVIQGHFRTTTGDTRVAGIPILVHRRCEREIFDISNRIAYADRMIHATPPGESPIRNLLGRSCWVDVADGTANEKYVEQEGILIARVVEGLCRELEAAPDLYVICPFRGPARKLRSVLLGRTQAANAAGMGRESWRNWIAARVGTVHTFQGKEADSVFLMLGAGRGARPGSRTWAASTPNILNVAATRAKRALYIVGNQDLWHDVGVFAEASPMLPKLTPETWTATLNSRLRDRFGDEADLAVQAEKAAAALRQAAAAQAPPQLGLFRFNKMRVGG